MGGVRNLLLAVVTALFGISRSVAGEFVFPAACTAGDDCFIQMMPDMDPGNRAVDPFCGSATRDGYPGTDIRLRSMADVARGVNIFAISGGMVFEARDGLDDRLVRSKKDAELALGHECGNGIAVDHGEGIVAYYCHMRRASLEVGPGDRISKGQTIGKIGASGMAHYPGLHITITRNGRIIDPISGKQAGDDCGKSADQSQSLFPAAKLHEAGFGEAGFLGSGLTGMIVDPGNLSLTGAPEQITAQSSRLMAWSWLVNIRRGDRVQLRLFGPAGGIVAAKTTLPARKPQAELAVYAGRHGKPAPGRYRVVVELLRDGKAVKTDERSIIITG